MAIRYGARTGAGKGRGMNGGGRRNQNIGGCRFGGKGRSAGRGRGAGKGRLR